MSRREEEMTIGAEDGGRVIVRAATARARRAGPGTCGSSANKAITKLAPVIDKKYRQ